MIDKIRFKIINYLLKFEEKDLIVTSMFSYYFNNRENDDLHSRVITFTRKINY